MSSDNKKPGNNIWEELLEQAKRTEDAANAVMSDARRVHHNVRGMQESVDGDKSEKLKEAEGFDNQMRACLGRIRETLDVASNELSSLK